MKAAFGNGNVPYTCDLPTQVKLFVPRSEDRVKMRSPNVLRKALGAEEWVTRVADGHGNHVISLSFG